MALKEEHKKQLTLLREQYPGSGNAEDIDGIENELSSLLDSIDQLKNPVFKKFATRAADKTNSLNALLLNDRTLLNEKGLALSQERDMWAAILSAFGMDDTNEAIKALEDLIESKITT